jgi:hypothetical protein
MNKRSGWGGLTLTNSYLQTKRQREAYEEQKGEIVFGLLGGFLLLVLGIVNNWPIYGSINVYAIMSYIIIAIGLCFLLLGIIAPALLGLPYKVFVFIGKKIGSAILIILLTIIYGVMVFPVGVFMRKKRKRTGFFTWTGNFPYEETSFQTIRTDDKKNAGSSIKLPFLKSLYNLFGTLIRNKRTFLIPTTVVLVLLGLILFFAASNVVFNFFIYTLF